MILLDTHVWWWSLAEPDNLSNGAVSMIKSAKTDERFIASISIWEFAMMVAKKRIELKTSPEQCAIAVNGFFDPTIVCFSEFRHLFLGDIEQFPHFLFVMQN
jgi:hypothetical protein